MGYRVLYHHAPCDTRGSKRKSGKPPQGYLVLYHRKSSARHPYNQLQYRLGRGYHVLYHLQAQGKLFVPPLFQFRVAATEVSGIVINPAAFSRLFTSRLAFLLGAGSLTITDSAIRNKKTTAEFTTLAHGHLRKKYPELVVTVLQQKYRMGKDEQRNLKKEEGDFTSKPHDRKRTRLRDR